MVPTKYNPIIYIQMNLAPGPLAQFIKQCIGSIYRVSPRNEKRDNQVLNAPIIWLKCDLKAKERPANNTFS
jgi:hypothetical protein